MLEVMLRSVNNIEIEPDTMGSENHGVKNPLERMLMQGAWRQQHYHHYPPWLSSVCLNIVPSFQSPARAKRAPAVG